MYYNWRLTSKLQNHTLQSVWWREYCFKTRPLQVNKKEILYNTLCPPSLLVWSERWLNFVCTCLSLPHSVNKPIKHVNLDWTTSSQKHSTGNHNPGVVQSISAHNFPVSSSQCNAVLKKHLRLAASEKHNCHIRSTSWPILRTRLQVLDAFYTHKAGSITCFQTKYAIAYCLLHHLKKCDTLGSRQNFVLSHVIGSLIGERILGSQTKWWSKVRCVLSTGTSCLVQSQSESNFGSMLKC